MVAMRIAGGVAEWWQPGLSGVWVGSCASFSNRQGFKPKFGGCPHAMCVAPHKKPGWGWQRAWPRIAAWVSARPARLVALPSLGHALLVAT